MAVFPRVAFSQSVRGCRHWGLLGHVGLEALLVRLALYCLISHLRRLVL